MRVKTGSSAMGRTADVELDSLDGENTFKQWGQWDTNVQFKKLSALADYMLVEYMRDAKMLSLEHANDRLETLSKVLK